jgi:hypothetical protein
MAEKTLKKQKTTSKPKQLISDEERRSLRTWNIRFAVLLALQAIAIVVIGTHQTVPITTQYLATNTLLSEANGHQVLALATRHLVDVPLSWIVAKFLVVLALVYLLAATVWRKKYEAWLERGVNKLRWLGFGVGGGVMAVAMATLIGVSDIATLWLVFGAVVLVGGLAAIVELIGADRRLRCLAAWMAGFGAILLWLLFIVSLIGVFAFNGSLPTFVYYIYASMFLLSGAVALATYMRVTQRGRWASTVYAERMFMVLAFLAVTILAWQIFAGTLLG